MIPTPNRILKESICVNGSIDSLSWFEEALYYRLIVNCDDYGRFDGRPAVIKSRLFPLKENLTSKTVSDAVRKLASVGLVVLYEFENAPYLYLPTWDKHQTVRAKRSKYPSPDNACTNMKASANICNQMQTNVPVIQSVSESEDNAADADSARARDPELARAIDYYSQKVNPCLGRMESDGLVEYYRLFGADALIYAVDKALAANKRTWTYIRGILKGWERQGVKTLADAQRLDADFEAQKRNKPVDRGKGGKSPAYDYGSKEGSF